MWSRRVCYWQILFFLLFAVVFLPPAKTFLTVAPLSLSLSPTVSLCRVRIKPRFVSNLNGAKDCIFTKKLFKIVRGSPKWGPFLIFFFFLVFNPVSRLGAVEYLILIVFLWILEIFMGWTSLILWVFCFVFCFLERS